MPLRIRAAVGQPVLWLARSGAQTRVVHFERSGNVRVDGGLTRSDYLLQLQADILGMPVQRAEIEHLTPLGVGLLAGLSAGLWSDLDDLKKLAGAAETFQPRLDGSVQWDRRYETWCDAVDLVLSWPGERLEQ